jgi:hypothetical protein
MVVLDEQLLGYGLQSAIARWYRGAVTDITQLRPGTTILDDAIPSLLRAEREPSFITINVSDFWRRLAPRSGFCNPLIFSAPFASRGNQLPAAQAFSFASLSHTPTKTGKNRSH